MGLLVDYFDWHYRKKTMALMFTLSAYVAFIYHYFSLGILLATLFAPWKREKLRVKDIFPLGPFLEAFTFNVVSIIMGTLIRLITMLIGVIVLLATVAVCAIIAAMWLGLPILSLPAYLASLRETPLDSLRKQSTMKEAFFYLVDSKEGKFVIDRLNLDHQELISLGKSSFDAALPDDFAAIASFSDGFKIVASGWIPLATYLKKINIDPSDVYEVAVWFESWQKEKRISSIWNADVLLRTPGIGHTWSYGYSPTLDAYTYPQSFETNPLGPLLAHGEEIGAIESALSKLVHNSVLVIGEAGTARHSLVATFANRLRSGHTIPQLRYKQVLNLSLDKIVGETRPNEASEKLEEVLEEAESAGNIILVIDALDRFVCKTSTPNFADIFSQYVGSGRVQIIGITTTEGYHECFEPNTKLERNFTVIGVEEPKKEQMVRILEASIPRFEAQYGVFVTFQAMKEIIQAAQDLYPAIPFPQKAIDAIDTVASQVSKSGNRAPILPEKVQEILSQESHIPYGKIQTVEKETLVHLEPLLHQHIIDQHEAVEAIANALRRARVGIKEDKKPIGSFLFLGPTGVGKTETAKALAFLCFGSKDHLIRVDMSEYQDAGAQGRLIGDAHTQEAGQLTGAIRDHPFSVLLLDEFEKASAQIHNLFLTVFDEGYLIDGFGHSVFFHNCIIIATSNAGAEFIRESLQEKQSIEHITKELTNRLLQEKVFTPELVNRFDGVVVFKPLTPQHLTAIAHLLIKELNTKLQKEHGVTVEVTDAFLADIIKEGYDPAFGARPMRRVIQKTIEDVLSKKLLSGQLKRGDSIRL